jgi:hypothetical protein
MHALFKPRLHCPVLPAVDYVAMTPEGRIFDSSLAKGYPYQIRVGAGQVRACGCVLCSLRPRLRSRHGRVPAAGAVAQQQQQQQQDHTPSLTASVGSSLLRTSHCTSRAYCKYEMPPPRTHAYALHAALSR